MSCSDPGAIPTCIPMLSSLFLVIDFPCFLWCSAHKDREIYIYKKVLFRVPLFCCFSWSQLNHVNVNGLMCDWCTASHERRSTLSLLMSHKQQDEGTHLPGEPASTLFSPFKLQGYSRDRKKGNQSQLAVLLLGLLGISVEKSLNSYHPTLILDIHFLPSVLVVKVLFVWVVPVLFLISSAVLNANFSQERQV